MDYFQTHDIIFSDFWGGKIQIDKTSYRSIVVSPPFNFERSLEMMQIRLVKRDNLTRFPLFTTVTFICFSSKWFHKLHLHRQFCAALPCRSSAKSKQILTAIKFSAISHTIHIFPLSTICIYSINKFAKLLEMNKSWIVYEKDRFASRIAFQSAFISLYSNYVNCCQQFT